MAAIKWLLLRYENTGNKVMFSTCLALSDLRSYSSCVTYGTNTDLMLGATHCKLESRQLFAVNIEPADHIHNF
jgi:hypothetical protein